MGQSYRIFEQKMREKVEIRISMPRIGWYFLAGWILLLGIATTLMVLNIAN